MEIVRDSSCGELVLHTFSVISLICTSNNSSHVIKFVNLGIIDLIKQRLTDIDTEMDHKIATNAAFSLSNIVAEPDAIPHHAVLRSRVFQEALIPLLQRADITCLLRYELTSAMGNFFIHCDFDLCYYVFSDCPILHSIVSNLIAPNTDDITLLALLYAANYILSVTRKFKRKAQKFKIMSAITRADEILLSFETQGGIDALE